MATKKRTRPSRAGFSMVEMLGVILIIIILMALLLPALGRAIIGVKDANVKVDITAIEKAIADFRATYGVEPPSQVSLYAEEAGWNGDIRSKALIRKIWPQFDFSIDRTSSFPSGVTELYLNGAECLVFFLGGVYPASSEKDLRGFSKNPANPLIPPTGTETRVGPFHEFVASRLVDVDSDGFYEYLDPLPNQTHPYIYASSYDGRGYRTEELSNSATDKGLMWQWNTASPTFTIDAVMQHKDSSDNFTNDFYRQSQDGGYYKPKSFQIISPGRGPHVVVGAGTVPYGRGDGASLFDAVFNPEDTVNLSTEGGDNITNFHTGTLK